MKTTTLTIALFLLLASAPYAWCGSEKSFYEVQAHHDLSTMKMAGLSVGADSSEVYSESDMEDSFFLYSDEDLYMDMEPIPYDKVEVPPTFKGGDINSFYKWVSENLTYPEICKENGVSGTADISFIIDAEGYVTDVKVIRSTDPEFGKEAVRVISKSPKWAAGTQDYMPVKVSCAIQVTFKLR